MYFSAHDVGHMQSMVWNWPQSDVRVIVVTDGSRILGLGDLGVNGMGIPIGKLALYCAAGGIAPHRVMPVQIDVGTDNAALRDDPFYLGLKTPRLQGEEYYGVLAEFMHAVKARWPKVLIQFEDFSSDKALNLLDKYRGSHLCFNDDIQGTGATCLAGAMACLRQRGLPVAALAEQRVVIAGAGSAGAGVAAALRDGMVAESRGALTPEQAARNFWMLDKDGLLARGGADEAGFTPEQLEYARPAGGGELARGASLLDVVRAVKPTMLLGLSTVRGLFDEPVIRALGEGCEHPVVMPLSNPTRNAECTAEEAYTWTDGRAIVASGSPFAPVELRGKTYIPSQCNNMFIFPGVGLGASLCGSKVVTDGMLHAASVACAEAVDADEMARGQVFPSVGRIRGVSQKVAVAVIEAAVREGLANRASFDDDLHEWVNQRMYYPAYVPITHSPYRE